MFSLLVRFAITMGALVELSCPPWWSTAAAAVVTLTRSLVQRTRSLGRVSGEQPNIRHFALYNLVAPMVSILLWWFRS